MKYSRMKKNATFSMQMNKKKQKRTEKCIESTKANNKMY